MPSSPKAGDSKTKGQPEDAAAGSELPADLLAILVCPGCRKAVEQHGDWLVCRACALAYPVRDGVPIMLKDEASPLGAAGVPTAGGAEPDAPQTDAPQEGL